MTIDSTEMKYETQAWMCWLREGLRPISNVVKSINPFVQGSTYGRQADRKERKKAHPTFKDLDFMEMYPDGIYLQPEIHNCLMDTIVRDCRALESLKIMDYSLLMGIHNIDQGRKL